MNSHTKITKARAAMIQSQRFFGSLALRLIPQESRRIETIATDGTHLLYNPDWIGGARETHVIAMCAKMAAHIALLHHTRRRGRDKKKWQTACDYAVNPLIQNADFTLPDDALLNPAFAGKAAEEIYRLLPDDDQGGQGEGDGAEAGASAGSPQGPQDGQDGEEPGTGEGEDGEGDGEGAPEEAPPSPDPGGCGQVLDAEAPEGGKPSQAETEQIEADTQVAVVQAANLAKAAGQGHADIDRLVKDIKQAQTDWREELRRYMQQAAKNRYDWCRPNRRFISQGLYLPSLRGEAMGEMVVAIDTSGSVIDWLPDFAKELSGIIEDVRPEKVTVLYCDDRVAGVAEFTVDDMPLTLVAKGYGGTSFIPAFRWVEEQGIDPACLVYLTDLYGRAPDKAPDYPVIWACTTDQEQPWGERVQLRR